MKDFRAISLLALVCLVMCPIASAVSATISNPVFPTGVKTLVLLIGVDVPVTYTITNTDSSKHDFYMGYSVKPSDRSAPTDSGWYDAPAIKVTLDSGQSATKTLTAHLPDSAPCNPFGLPYDVTIAVWGGKSLWGNSLQDELDRRWNYQSFTVAGY